MDKITLEYSFLDQKDKSTIIIKAVDDNWRNINTSYLLSEVGETVFNTSCAKIHFNLNSLLFIGSSFFGVIMNIVDKAKTTNKIITFSFSNEVLETVKNTGLDKVLTITNQG